jgi:hypothetical protein
MDRAKHGRFPHRCVKIQLTKEILAEAAKISATDHEDQESKVKERGRELISIHAERKCNGCCITEHQAS